jgi:RNA polymerase sigma-70 factor (ECF subfamily)
MLPPNHARPASAASSANPAPSGRILRLPLPESDTALVAALQNGREDAREELVVRYADDVERLLYRVLGPDSEIPDLLQEVFVVGLTSLHRLRDPHALRSWLCSIAVRKARKLIAHRRRWRFIRSVPSSELPEREAPTSSAEVSEALRCTYRILDTLPVEERIAFALRHIDGMELTDVAAVMEVSLATIKRRLGRAQQSFTALARNSDALGSWLSARSFER